jgi:hypothetical protein
LRCRSQAPISALALPVTGSSGTLAASAGQNARTTRVWSVPASSANTATPVASVARLQSRRAAMSGARPRTAAASRSGSSHQRAPLSQSSGTCPLAARASSASGAASRRRQLPRRWAGQLDLQCLGRAAHPHRQHPRRALLQQGAVARLRQAAAHRRPGRADAGVAGEGQLAGRGEDADVVVGAGRAGAQEEHRLGQVQPGGQGLHLLAGERIGVQDGAQWIAGAGAGAKTSSCR